MTDTGPEDRVRPLPPDPEDPAGYALPVSPEPDAQKSKRGWIVGGIVLAIVAVLAVGSVIAYRTIIGDAFASTRAVPDNAQIVVTFDLLQVRDTSQIQALFDAFAEPMAANGDVEAGFDIVEEIDRAWEEEMGITLSEDVVPWLGRSASIAVWPDGSSLVATEDVQVLVSIGVRNGAGAEAFVDKMMAYAVENEGGVLEVGTIDGRKSWLFVPDSEWADPVAVVLDGDLLLASIDERTLRTALAASDDGGLGADPDYQAAMDLLPPDRVVAYYMSADVVLDIYRDPMFDDLAPTDGVLEALDGWEALSGAITLADDGVRFDVVQTFEPNSEAETAWGSLEAGDLRFRDRLPVETYGFAAAAIPDAMIDEQIAALEELDPEAFTELRTMSIDLLGVDLIEEVLPNLGREMMFAGIESGDGLLASEADFPIGIALALGVLDPAPVRDAVNSLEELAIEEGAPLVVEGGVGIIADGGETAVAYTVSEDGLVVASSASLLDTLTIGPGGLTSSPLYEELDGALPGDGLLFYLDTHRIYDHIPWPDQGYRAVADPVRGAGAAVSNSADAAAASFLILIDY